MQTDLREHFPDVSLSAPNIFDTASSNCAHITYAIPTRREAISHRGGIADDYGFNNVIVFQ